MHGILASSITGSTGSGTAVMMAETASLRHRIASLKSMLMAAIADKQVRRAEGLVTVFKLEWERYSEIIYDVIDPTEIELNKHLDEEFQVFRLIYEVEELQKTVEVDVAIPETEVHGFNSLGPGSVVESSAKHLEPIPQANKTHLELVTLLSNVGFLLSVSKQSRSGQFELNLFSKNKIEMKTKDCGLQLVASSFGRPLYGPSITSSSTLKSNTQVVNMVSPRNPLLTCVCIESFEFLNAFSSLASLGKMDPGSKKSWNWSDEPHLLQEMEPKIKRQHSINYQVLLSWSPGREKYTPNNGTQPTHKISLSIHKLFKKEFNSITSKQVERNAEAGFISQAPTNSGGPSIPFSPYYSSINMDDLTPKLLPFFGGEGMEQYLLLLAAKLLLHHQHIRWTASSEGAFVLIQLGIVNFNTVSVISNMLFLSPGPLRPQLGGPDISLDRALRMVLRGGGMPNPFGHTDQKNQVQTPGPFRQLLGEPKLKLDRALRLVLHGGGMSNPLAGFGHNQQHNKVRAPGPFRLLLDGLELRLDRALRIVLHGGGMSNYIGHEDHRQEQEEDCIIFTWQPSTRKSRVFDPGGSTLKITLFLEISLQELSIAEAGCSQHLPVNPHPLWIYPLEQLEPILVLSILWWAGWIDRLPDLHFNHPPTSIASTIFAGTYIRFRKPGFRIDFVFQSVASMFIIKTFKSNHYIYRFKLRRAFNMIPTTHRWFDFDVASARLRIKGHLYYPEKWRVYSIRVFTSIILQHSSSVNRPPSSYASAPVLINSTCWWRSTSLGTLDSSHWFRPEELDNNFSRVFVIGQPPNVDATFEPSEEINLETPTPVDGSAGEYVGNYEATTRSVRTARARLLLY